MIKKINENKQAEQSSLEISSLIRRKTIKGIVMGTVFGIILAGTAGVAAVTLSADQVTYTPNDSNFKVNNTKAAIDELYQLSQIGNATANDLLTGKEALAGGQKIIGSMANRGALNWNPSTNTTYTVPAGYYSGGTLNSANAYNAGISYADGRVNTNSASDSNGYNAGFINGKNNYSVIQLKSSYSKLINYPGGTITATFNLPNGKKYLGAGLSSITFNVSNGGLYGTPTISFNGAKTITFSANVAGNWGDNTTISGNVTLNVFVTNE